MIAVRYVGGSEAALIGDSDTKKRASDEASCGTAIRTGAGKRNVVWASEGLFGVVELALITFSGCIASTSRSVMIWTGLGGSTVRLNGTMPVFRKAVIIRSGFRMLRWACP